MAYISLDLIYLLNEMSNKPGAVQSAVSKVTRSAECPRSIGFHSFPKNSETSNLWKERCDIRLTDSTSGFYVCSKHFTPDDYVEPRAKELGGRLVLKPNRIPSMKVPNSVIVTVPSTSSSELPHPEVGESAMQTDANMCTPKKRKIAEPRYFGDITSPDFATPKRARKAWHVLKDQMKSMKFKNRALNQKDRRLEKKVASLQDMLKHLREKIISLKMLPKH